jgi:lysophospholipase L1-like esterase
MLAGDSITQGSIGRHTWRYRLWRHLQSTGAAVDFVGSRRDVYDDSAHRGGSMAYADPSFDKDHNAQWGRPLAEAATTIEAEVRAARPDYLLVLLGINDLMGGAGPAATEAALVRFIAGARRGNERIRIVVGTPLPTKVTVKGIDLTAQVDDYAARLKAVASVSTTTTSPIRVAATSKDVVPDVDLYDGLHPNARGEIKIAAAFATALAVDFAVGGPFVVPPTAGAQGTTTATHGGAAARPAARLSCSRCGQRPTRTLSQGHHERHRQPDITSG